MIHSKILDSDKSGKDFRNKLEGGIYKDNKHKIISIQDDEQGHISVHIFCGNASVVLERILDHLVNVIDRIQMFDQLNQL